MSNDSGESVRESEEVDPRVARSTRALGRALIELIQERDFSEITVQSILDRSGVGRATFYAHYRNKEDVLHSAYERVFATFEERLNRREDNESRLFPVTEFVAHVADLAPVMAGLRASGRFTELWLSAVDYAAGIIKQRLVSNERLSGAQRHLVSRMLAGAMLESLQWWLDHQTSATPAQLDAAFHRLAHAFLHYAN